MPPPSTIPGSTPVMPVSVMHQGNGGTWKAAKMEKVEVEIEDDLLPSCDSFANMYDLLFDGNHHELLPEKCGSSFDITGNFVFDKIDEIMMDMAWDDDVFVDADNGMVVTPNDNEVMVKKEMDLIEMISQSSGTSNCVGYS